MSDGPVRVLEDRENQPQPHPRVIQVPQTGGSESVCLLSSVWALFII